MAQSNAAAKVTAESTGKDGWGVRGDYWIKKLNPIPQYKARKRRIIHKPLVLSGYGIKLNIDRGTLLIKCGFTHYPQKPEEYRFFPRDRQLPSRIVILDGDGSITFRALEWLSEQSISLVQINWKGEVSCIGGASYAANPDLVDHQLKLQKNKHGSEFAKWIINEKIKNSYEAIKHISNNSAEAKPMLEKMREQAVALQKESPRNTASLLAIEGIAAAAYFRYWYTLSLRWKGLKRNPVPQEWLKIGTRIGSNSKSNQFAVHPVNAILNYAYGVLENQVKGYIVAAGVDPAIGYIHSNGKDRNSLVFDLIEPLRPIMDQKVLEFVLNRTFSPDDFILNKNGVCRLNPQFARYVVKAIQDIPEIEKITELSLKKLFSYNIP